MGLYCKNRRIIVGNYDTFSIQVVLRGHIPTTSEKFVFTVRRVLETPKRMGKAPEVGAVVFRQVLRYNDLTLIKDGDNILGCYFYITATKAQAAQIPQGMNAYDLAAIDTFAHTEYELIPPSEFWVGEVLRYE